VQDGSEAPDDKGLLRIEQDLDSADRFHTPYIGDPSAELYKA
jgi:hypothetical protein